MSNLNNSADGCPVSNKMSHYFTEGETAFFSLSTKDILDRLPKKDEDELPVIFVYMKIKPKMLDNVTLSSVQIVSYTIFAAASLTIHSKPFVSSLPLITALFIATLTLALFPRKSRLLDMRSSVFSLSIGLSVVLALYFISTYFRLRVVSFLYPKIISPDIAQILGGTVLLLILTLYVSAFIIDCKRRKWFKCKEKQTECKSGTENTKS